MRIAYVLEDLGLSGGVKVVIEHCNGLAARGHEVTLFAVTQSGPKDWFKSKGFSIEILGTWDALLKRLARYNGCKVATWWRTAPVVAQSGGRGFYLVQDIETSYASDQQSALDVLSTYKLTLGKITEGKWVTDQLIEDCSYVGIGIDHDVFKFNRMPRRNRSVLYNYRGHFLKGPELFVDAANRLPHDMQVVTYGLDTPPIDGVIHKGFVSEIELSTLYNTSSVYVSTSTHEGFCLPIVEAMACGCPVVTTDSHANMEFCIDGVNCIVVGRDPAELAYAIERVCSDRALADRLSREGRITARRYRWEWVIERLERVYNG